jgi:hypothetical protein
MVSEDSEDVVYEINDDEIIESYRDVSRALDHISERIKLRRLAKSVQYQEQSA